MGALALLGSSALLIRRSLGIEEVHAQLEAEADKVLGQISKSSAAEVDSLFDPVWTYVGGTRDGGVKVTLEDVSSRLNLNTVRTELFEKTDLGGLLTLGHSAMELRQFRADKGPFQSVSSFDGFFPPGTLAGDFTVYGYVNINTTFEDVLRAMFAARTGDTAAADSFQGAIRGFLTRQELVTREQLAVLFGLYAPQMSPLVNVEPQMNVNFIPPEVLHAVLSYPYGGKKIANSEALYTAILSDRQSQGLTPQYLANLIPAKGAQLLVFQYLGTRTWFWRITIAGGSRSLVKVVAGFPGNRGHDLRSWKAASSDVVMLNVVMFLLAAVPISVGDLRERRIPNASLASGLLLALWCASHSDSRRVLDALLAAAVGFAVFWCLWYFSRGRMGMGDVNMRHWWVHSPGSPGCARRFSSRRLPVSWRRLFYRH